MPQIYIEEVIVIAVQFEKTGVVNASGEGVNPNLIVGSNVSITQEGNISTPTIKAIPDGTEITVSVQIDADNVVWGSGNRRLGMEFNITKTAGGYQYIGAWAGQTVNPASNVWVAFTGSYHGRVSHTFTLEGAVPNGRYVAIYIQGLSSGTVKVSKPKIELGSVATPWCPNESDPEYVGSALGFTELETIPSIGKAGYVQATEFIEW